MGKYSLLCCIAWLIEAGEYLISFCTSYSANILSLLLYNTIMQAVLQALPCRGNRSTYKLNKIGDEIPLFLMPLPTPNGADMAGGSRWERLHVWALNNLRGDFWACGGARDRPHGQFVKFPSSQLTWMRFKVAPAVLELFASENCCIFHLNWMYKGIKKESKRGEDWQQKCKSLSVGEMPTVKLDYTLFWLITASFMNRLDLQSNLNLLNATPRMASGVVMTYDCSV